MALRNALVGLLFILAACDEGGANEPVAPLPAIHIRNGTLAEIEHVGGMALRYWSGPATTLDTIAVEVRYSTGHGEVWVVPSGGVIVHRAAASWAHVYPCTVDIEVHTAATIHTNADGTLVTTTGTPTSGARITSAQSGWAAGWEVR